MTCEWCETPCNDPACPHSTVRNAEPERCGACQLGAAIAIRDVDYGVTFATYRTCTVCGWHLVEDRASFRAMSVERWFPPENLQRPVSAGED